ncbi:hypothetical protein KW795_02890 [Candidatus Microgenomates bacterium]|nr:hypothetical protein [Candidatus Microgenomates bacterium]
MGRVEIKSDEIVGVVEKAKESITWLIFIDEFKAKFEEIDHSDVQNMDLNLRLPFIPEPIFLSAQISAINGEERKWNEINLLLRGDNYFVGSCTARYKYLYDNVMQILDIEYRNMRLFSKQETLQILDIVSSHFGEESIDIDLKERPLYESPQNSISVN